MPENQIQPVRRDYAALAQRSRPRGVVGQVWAGLLQPAQFYRTMPPLSDTRTWLWAAILILALVSFSAVRQESLRNGSSTDLSGGFETPIDSGAGLGGDPFGGGGIPLGGDPFGGTGGAPVTPTADAGDVTGTWTTALITSAGIILGWFVLSILLSEITLFNGRAPRLGLNLQVAIWSTLPLALMAALQLVFFAAGGQPGGAGLSGLLDRWDWYNTQSEFVRNLLFSLASNATVFWIWSLVLIYVGGRNTLRGKHWAIALVVIAWAAIVIVAPVLTGQVKAPEATLPDELVLPGDDSGLFPDGSESAPGSEEILPGSLGLPEGFQVDGIEPTAEEMPIEAVPTVVGSP